MKKTLRLLMLSLLVLTLFAGLIACAHKEASDHTPVGEWLFDETYHWHACEKEKCEDAGDRAEHDPATAYSKNDTNHWYDCIVCGYDVSVEQHVFNQSVASSAYLKSAATASTKAVYYKSCKCGQAGTDTFETDKTAATISDLAISGKVYDGIAVSAPTYVTDSNGAVTVEYSVKNANSFSVTAPVNAGEYTVKVSVAETETYDSVSATKDFVITKATATITDIVMAGKVYDGEVAAVPAYVTNSDGTATVEYSVKNANSFSTTAPVNAGEYTVRVSVAEADNYTAVSSTVDFTIAKATGTISNLAKNDVYYNGSAIEAPTYSTNSDGVATIEYKLVTEEDSAYTTDVPVNAGKYVARLTVAEAGNYTEVTDTIEFTILKATSNLEISISGKTYDGAAIDTLQYSTNNNNSTVFVQYRNNAQSGFTTSVPVNAGEYTVKVTINESDNYTSVEKTATFIIEKATATIDNVVMNSKVYDGVAVSAPTYETNSNGSVTIEYSVKNADEYSTTAPINVGTYEVRISIAEATNYTAVSTTKDFSIDEAGASITGLNVADKTYDGNPIGAPTYTVNSDGEVTVEYKVKNADDATYTTEKPVNAGEYTVRVSVAETVNYAYGEATKDFTISKATGEINNIIVEEREYDGNPIADPSYETNNYEGEVTIEYSQKDANAFGTNIPKNAGEYTVRITIAESENYTEVSATGDFTIAKATAYINNMVANSKTYDGTGVKPTYETNSNAYATIEYKDKGEDDSEYGVAIPTYAGDYTVRVTLDENNNYLAVSATADFTIEKASGSITNFAITDKTYDGTAVSAPTYETNSDGAVTVEYSVKNANSFSATAPVNAGVYTVRISVAEVQNYTAVVDTRDFFIEKAEGVITDLAISGKVYDGTAVSAPTYNTNSDGAVTVEYSEKDANNYSAVVPVNAGEYTVKVLVAEAGNYTVVVATKDFVIEKATATIDNVVMNSKVYDGVAVSAPTYETNSNGSVTIEYSVKNADEYSTTAPINVGTYEVRISIAEATNYTAVSTTKDFSIDEAGASITGLNIADKTYDGNPISAPTYTVNSDGEVTVEYKVKNADDATYTTEKPVNAGEYTVRVSVAETVNYAYGEATRDFTINKVVSSIVGPAISGKTYDGTAIVAPEYDTNSNGTVVVEYKVKNADDATYTTERPVNAGDYTVRVKVEEATNYTAISATKDFTINKATTTLTVSISDKTYDGVAITAPTYETNSDGEVVIEYKVQGADNATYTTTAPINANIYEVRVTVKEATNYTELSKYAYATISRQTTAIENVVFATKTYDGTAISAPTVTTNSDGEIVVKYKLTSAVSEPYGADAPINAGEYIAEITVKEATNYTQVTTNKVFTIEKKELTQVTVTKTYDGTVNISDYAITAGNSNAEVLSGDEVFLSAQFNSANVTAANAVSNVLLSGEDAGNYSLDSSAITASITKDTAYINDINVDDKDYDGNPINEPMFVSNYSSVAIVEYKVKDAADNTYTTAKPVNAGSYTVRVTVEGTDNYNGAEATSDFTISTVEAGITNIYMSDNDIQYTEPYQVMVETVNFDGEVVIEYKVKDADDATYETIQPTAIGEYTARVTLSATINTEAVSETIDFTISKYIITDYETTVVYTGEFTYEIDLSEYEENLSLLVDFEYVDVGSAVSNVRVTDIYDSESDNFGIDLETMNVTIVPATVEVVWMAPEDLEYDGTAKVPTAELSGVLQADELNFGYTLVEGDDNVNYNSTFRYVATINNDNYVLDSETEYSPEYDITIFYASTNIAIDVWEGRYFSIYLMDGVTYYLNTDDLNESMTLNFYTALDKENTAFTVYSTGSTVFSVEMAGEYLVKMEGAGIYGEFTIEEDNHETLNEYGLCSICGEYQGTETTTNCNETIQLAAGEKAYFYFAISDVTGDIKLNIKFTDEENVAYTAYYANGDEMALTTIADTFIATDGVYVVIEAVADVDTYVQVEETY